MTQRFARAEMTKPTPAHSLQLSPEPERSTVQPSSLRYLSLLIFRVSCIHKISIECNFIYVQILCSLRSIIPSRFQLPIVNRFGVLPALRTGLGETVFLTCCPDPHWSSSSPFPFPLLLVEKDLARSSFSWAVFCMLASSGAVCNSCQDSHFPSHHCSCRV